MNRKIKAVFEGYGMQIDNNKAYGNVNGYETSVITWGEFSLHFSFYATEDQRGYIEHSMRTLAIKMLNFQLTYFGMKVTITDLTLGALAKRLGNVIEVITDILKTNGALGSEYCPVCGSLLNKEAKEKRLVDGVYITMDADCVTKVNEQITQDNREFAAAPNNYLKGFLGAVIGGLSGAVVAIILFFIGFISAWTSFLAVFVGALLYQKFGGKPNKMMIVIVSVTAIVLMLLSTFLLHYYAAAFIVADELGVVMKGSEAFKLCMEDSAFKADFVSNMFMTAIFAILGCVLEVVRLSRKIKRQKNI